MKNIFQHIPPTGNPIYLKSSEYVWQFTSGTCIFVQSGTAALATALIIAKNTYSRSSRSEVLLPAYCCPDLLSAILYCGLKPVLIDLEQNSPYMDIELLKATISEKTLAIIAVNFLGIPERISKIKELTGNSEVVLIEDSAQWFPENEEDSNSKLSDIVIYSFGKGKPVCLLGGGLTLIQDPNLKIPEPLLSTADTSVKKLLTLLKFIAYNTVISSKVYWALELMPFISLGQTEYKALESIEPMDEHRQKFLLENIKAYRKYKQYNQPDWFSVLNDINLASLSVPENSETYARQKLLRYPIIFANRETKHRFIKQASQLGLGISPLYPHSLPRISLVPQELFRNSNTPNAEDFAQRLSTLPTHNSVNSSHLGALSKVLKSL